MEMCEAGYHHINSSGKCPCENSLQVVCTNCGRPKGEHSREALIGENQHGWKWNKDACPIGSCPFHPTQTFTDCVVESKTWW
jgi:hypothetical protein